MRIQTTTGKCPLWMWTAACSAFLILKICGGSGLAAGPGEIVAWGKNDFGQATPPAGADFVAISAGGVLQPGPEERRDHRRLGFGDLRPGESTGWE